MRAAVLLLSLACLAGSAWAAGEVPAGAADESARAARPAARPAPRPAARAASAEERASDAAERRPARPAAEPPRAPRRPDEVVRPVSRGNVRDAETARGNARDADTARGNARDAETARGNARDAETARGSANSSTVEEARGARRNAAPTRNGRAAPPARNPAPAVAAPALAPPPAAAAPPIAVAAPPIAIAAPAPAAAPEPAPVAAVELAPVPPAPPPPSALRLRVVAPGRGLSIPFAEPTGAAVFRRGEAALAVFDNARPLDLAALREDPMFRAADSWQLPEGVVLRIPLAVGMTLQPRREGNAWVLEAMRDDARAAGERRRPISAEPDAGPPMRLAIAIEGEARVLAMEDPETGMPLLVGVLRNAGQNFIAARRLADFELLPTQQGAAVVARSDRLILRTINGRMLLTARGGNLRIGTPGGLDPIAEAVALTRILDLPQAPNLALQERLRGQQAAIAAAAPLARGSLRRDAAETLLAIGMPQEAQAMATLGLQEDPRMRADPRMLLVSGAAALLGGRLADAAPLEDSRLPDTDETLLWRGLLAAARGEVDLAASGIAPGMPLLFAYPEPVRRRLLPMAAVALAESDARAMARRLLAALPDEAAYAYARARLAEAEGRVEEALAGYAAVAAGRDRQGRARAIARGVELQLATGQIDAKAAADMLDRALFAWRGDGDELNTRLRIAALRRQSEAGRAAFELLRETVAQYPEQATRLRPDIAASFLEAIAQEPPVAAVALFDLHRDLLPPGSAAASALAGLAERLAALDLPDRAGALLQEAADRSDQRIDRASYGARLAALRLGERDAAGTLAALDATRFAELPAPLVQERAVLRARALAASGDRPAAEAVLAGLGTEGLAPLAALRADAQDWAGAAEALGRFLNASLPALPAPLDDVQKREATRLAAFLALSGNAAALTALREQVGPRMGEGPIAEAFGALIADPLRGIADLPRIRQELDLFRALPGRLSAQRML